jgi:predicted RNA-binding protein with PIN domain
LIEQVTDVKRYRVVTSDRAVASVAEARGIPVMSAASFAKQLEQPEQRPRRNTQRRQRVEPKLSRNEVDSWLREFGNDKEKDG